MPKKGPTDLAQDAADVRSSPSAEDIAQSQQVTDPLAGGAGLGSAAASALGSAMLGLDQAIRREPPAQVVAAEHQPERSIIGDDGDIVIEIPAAGEPPPSSMREPADD